MFSCGAGQYGQLGLGTTEDQNVPRLVESLSGENIVTIACGFNHSGAVSNYGVIYTWGNPANGRLGVYAVEPVTRPAKVTSIKSALAQSGQVRPLPNLAVVTVIQFMGDTVIVFTIYFAGQCGASGRTPRNEHSVGYNSNHARSNKSNRF